MYLKNKIYLSTTTFEYLNLNGTSVFRNNNNVCIDGPHIFFNNINVCINIILFCNNNNVCVKLYITEVPFKFRYSKVPILCKKKVTELSHFVVTICNKIN